MYLPLEIKKIEEVTAIGSKMYMGVHVSTRYSCPILMKLGFSQQIF